MSSELADVQAVKDFLSIKSSDNDAGLSALVSSVSAHVESLLNRTFAENTYAETRNGNGRTAILMQQRPLISVTSVAVDGVLIPPRPNVTSSGWTFGDEYVYLSGYCFNKGRQNVGIVYVAGFTVIPVEIQQAVVDICALKFRSRERVGMTAKGMAGETTTFFKDVPPDTMRVLMQYQLVMDPPA